MIYSVELTRSATADLQDIIEWIAANDSPDGALHVLEQIQSKTNTLTQYPERGVIPPELKKLGMDRYRQIFFKPYRIIYHVRASRVIINLIADGRRDMLSLLQRRLTSGF